jgi:hypothetical protein
MILLGLSVNADADKSILFQDKNLTIYTDNTLVYADGSVPKFKPSVNWVEEDYFIQQEKYCEVDTLSVEKLSQDSIKN